MLKLIPVQQILMLWTLNQPMLKNSYNGKMSALLILCILVLLAAQEVILLVLIIGLAFSLRDTALIIKYKGGYLKLFNDKSLFDSEKS